MGDASTRNRGKLRWILGVAALATPPLIANVAIRFARTGVVGGSPAPGSSLAPSASSTPARDGGRPPVRCARITPANFTLEPGGEQVLHAEFASDGVGFRPFSWSATGGMLGAVGEEPAARPLAGFVFVDDFDDGRIDDATWKASTTEGAAVVVKDGVLELTIPGGVGRDQAARLVSAVRLEGSFAAEVQVQSLQVDGTRGTAALTYETEDGFAAHVQRIAESAFQNVEANTRNPDGTWQGSTRILDRERPTIVRLLRGGPSVTFQANLGPDLVSLGARPHGISPGGGHLVLEAWSLSNGPSVTARFDNFGAAQNVNAVWRAPADAGVDDVYTIKLGDDCKATARIAER